MIGRPWVRKVQERYRTEEKRARNLDPYYRRFQKQMYGGREWMNIIMAIGTIDDIIVQKMNEIVRERTRAAQEAQQQNPLQQRRESQLPRSERAPRTVQGVAHQVSEGKRLRAEAKMLDKQIQRAWKAWEDRGQRWNRGWDEWQGLLRAREAAWDEAMRSTPTTVPLHHRRAVTDAAMALAATQGLGGHHIFLF